MKKTNNSGKKRFLLSSAIVIIFILLLSFPAEVKQQVQKVTAVIHHVTGGTSLWADSDDTAFPVDTNPAAWKKPEITDYNPDPERDGDVIDQPTQDEVEDAFMDYIDDSNPDPNPPVDEEEETETIYTGDAGEIVEATDDQGGPSEESKDDLPWSGRGGSVTPNPDVPVEDIMG